jgi:hypothetical protein
VQPADLPRREKVHVVHRPTVLGAFEFATLSSLRAGQLVRGCKPRIDETHGIALTAQLEVAEGKVERAPNHVPTIGAARPH